MKKLSNEILNKLIDNQLSSSEIDELHSLIKNDEKLLSKTKAHQMVDSVLKKMEVENAPPNTTELIMKNITNSVLAKDKKNGFFKVMISTFAVSIIIAIGFIFSSKPVVEANSESFTNTVINKGLEYFANFSLPISNNLLLVIASSLTVLILISALFIFEEHKLFKQKLDSIL